jgi:ubiquitin-like 1-activating enzyme E1 A
MLTCCPSWERYTPETPGMACVDQSNLSADEAKLYDRQIRLWGVEAQKRMKGARILICGFRSLSAEICKNLVLAGFSVVVQDSACVLPEDLGSHIFLNSDSIGLNVSLFIDS